jgi:hypothetical protein
MLSVRGFGGRVRPPKCDVESAVDDVEENDGGDDEGRPVLGNSGMDIGRVRTAALTEPGGELVGEKESDGEV